MRTQRLILFITALIFVGCFYAQAQLNLPTKNLGNDTYYYYKVKNGESIYGIASTIGVSVDDLVKYNPSARDGITKNQLLFLPVKEFGRQSNQAQSSSSTTATVVPSTISHIVKRGESVYGIARSYNLNVDDLVNYNPQIENGIKPGDVINIPQPDPSNPTASVLPADVDDVKDSPWQQVEEGIIYHTISRGETLYSLSKKYNTSIESIMSLNPGVTAAHFLADDVIKVKPGDNHSIVVNRPIQQFIPYEVKEGDTFETIAAANHINVVDLRSANPDIEHLKKGKTIYIPQHTIERQTLNTSQITEQDLEGVYASKIDDVYNDVHGIKHSDKISIAIVLPFQLHKAEPPRQALLYTDFYRGFAIAIDSIANKCGKEVNLDVYDTEHNLNVTDSLLALEKMKTYDVIIAPSEPKQLARINAFGQANNVTILNAFSTKNDDYTVNPMTMQVNIPSSYLSARVMDFIDNKYQDYTIVYLEDPDLEKKDIYKDLQGHFKQTGRPTKTLTIVHDLTFKSLSQYMDPGTNYLFLPGSGEKSLLNKVVSGIAQAKEQRFDCEVAMIGYPEYTIFANEFKSKFEAIDTYVFSRFYNPRDAKVADIENRYYRIFDDDIMNTTPNMMLIGFDTGMFIIKALSAGHNLYDAEAAYKGIQTSFNFERVSNWGGLINKSVKFIHFTPENKIIVEE